MSDLMENLENLEEPTGGGAYPRFTPVIDDNDYEIEVGEGEPEPEGPTKEELLAELERQKAELEASKGKPSGLGKDELLEILKAVKGSGSPSSQPAQAPGESEEEFEKRINSEQFEGNLTGLVKEVVKRYGGQMSYPMAQGNLEISKELVEKDDELGPVFRKYQNEIEEEINKVPLQQRGAIPHIYKRATEQAAARHWKELKTEGVEAMVSSAVEEKLKELGFDPSKKKEAPGVGYSAPAFNRPAPGGRTPEGKIKIRLSSLEEKYAMVKGMSSAQLYETLKANPRLKEQINKGAIPWLR